MEQNIRKNSKMPLIIGLAIAGTVVIAALAAVIILPKLSTKETRTKRRDREPSHKYATEYDIETDKTEYGVYKSWNVKKLEDDNGAVLSIWNSGHKETEIDYLSFNVYDNAADAGKAYKRMLEYYKAYSDSEVEEGFNWFTGWEPGVCDAAIYEMVCLQDNIIVYAELEVVSCWADDYWEDETYETTEPSETYFDRSTLRDYILGNSKDIREYVLHDILDY